MSTLTRHGLGVQLLPGWEGGIYRRPASSEYTTHPVLHAGNFALPIDRGDFGSGAVDVMGPDDVFIVLIEYHPDSTAGSLFAREDMPRVLPPEAFSPNTLQRAIPGQAGAQRFFSHAGRAFCLYVVLGSYRRRFALSAMVNRVLPLISIDELPS
jgi:hypothetical protein